MKLHEFLLAAHLRARKRFVLAARAEHEFLLAAHDVRTQLTWRNFSYNSGEDESEEDEEVVGDAIKSIVHWTCTCPLQIRNVGTNDVKN